MTETFEKSHSFKNNSLFLNGEELQLANSSLKYVEKGKDNILFIVKYGDEILMLKLLKNNEILYSPNGEFGKYDFIKIEGNKIIIDKEKIKNPKLKEFKEEIGNEDIITYEYLLEIAIEENNKNIENNKKYQKKIKEIEYIIENTYKVKFAKLMKTMGGKHYLGYLEVLEKDDIKKTKLFFQGFLTQLIGNDISEEKISQISKIFDGELDSEIEEYIENKNKMELFMQGIKMKK